MPFALSPAVWVDDQAPNKIAIRDLTVRSQLGDLPTRTEVATLTIPAAVKSLLTSGESVLADGKGGHYERVDADPGSVDKVRSVDRFLSGGSVDNTHGGWWQRVRSGPRINTQAGNYTLALADFDRPTIVEVTGAGTVTIPAGMPSDGIVIVEMIGAGGVSVEADSGVSLNGTVTGTKAISAQFDALMLRARGADVWIARGTTAIAVSGSYVESGYVEAGYVE